MTSWPWMQGIQEEAVADPIPPLCPEDDRPAVKDLIAQHYDDIQHLKNAIKTNQFYNANKHDDLWILRYWLSHSKANGSHKNAHQKALDAMQYTLQFRHDHNLDSKDIRRIPMNEAAHFQPDIRDFTQWWQDDAFFYQLPDPQRSLLCHVKVASMDQNAQVQNCPAELWLPNYLYSSEFSFQWLDYVTRTTGRLTKSIRFIDLHNVGLANLNKKCLERDSKAMGTMEDCYPQLLDTLYLVNAPKVLRVAWKMFKLMLPKRVLDKFDILDGNLGGSDNKSNNNKTNRLLKHVSLHHLPQNVGGTCPQEQLPGTDFAALVDRLETTTPSSRVTTTAVSSQTTSTKSTTTTTRVYHKRKISVEVKGLARGNSRESRGSSTKHQIVVEPLVA